MKRMASGLVAFSILALAAHAHADLRKVGSFTAVDLQGIGDVDIEVGGALSVDVQGPADLAALISTTVKGGTLVIDTPDDFSKKLKGRGDINLKVVIHVPALSKVTLSGTGEIEVDGIQNKAFDVAILGTGALDLAGKTENLRVNVSGTGQIKAKELVASAVELSVAGTAQAVLHASKSFDVSVQGTAAVKVLGKPATVKKTIVGTAAIDIK
jgi:Putative auto-transporter adhesin, head GIN domain